MSRIAQRFEALKTQGRKALIPYITAGDPVPGITVSLMHAMVESGADLIELGVPFSDPMADGPVIQAACERALLHHTSLRDVLAMVEAFRVKDADTPVILMGYLNPIEVMGYKIFSEQARAAGVDGVLTVDLPPEEAHDLVEHLRNDGIDMIFLLAPTSRDERIAKVAKLASGFIYYVSLKGVTGAKQLDVDSVSEGVSKIKAVTDIPVGVGFGIRDAAAAAAVAKVSDAVVVGSVLVNKIAELQDDQEQIAGALVKVLTGMRCAMDEVS
ncbi:MAG: tryptophan synthase subunit alpha [Gammaproteobacteria bacterium]|nr:tryptophan synthase subunit alpha [Gammaproteobacteria bacterium]